MIPSSKITKKGKVMFCLLLGYSGENYCGMQRNPGMKSIEEELITAMFKNYWITDTKNGNIHLADPTEKGASAAKQCISIKLRT